MDVFVQKWLYSGRSGSIREKVVVFRKKCCIRAFCMYSHKIVLFAQKSLNSGKVVVFGPKFFFSGKSGCIRDNGCIRSTLLSSG